MGLEETPEEFIAGMVGVFAEVKRVLRDDGTLWVNIGDTYVDKNLIGIPWMLAIALRLDGWVLRQDIIWSKPSPMPEAVVDRCCKAHEYIFLLSKQKTYYFDPVAIKENVGVPTRRAATFRDDRYINDEARNNSGNFDHKPPCKEGSLSLDGTNKRSVWEVASVNYGKGHFAVFPPKLINPCILAGTSAKGCCPVCGTPVERQVEKERVATRPGLDTKVTGDSATEGNRDPGRHVTSTRTTGWAWGCDCNPNADIATTARPCVVLDPFAGSGTTLAESVRLGRRAIGCELNPEYIPLIEERVKAGLAKKGFGIAV